MRTIDQSPVKVEDNAVKKLQATLEGILEKVFNWNADLKAQQLIAEHLSRLLDSKYTLLRNIRLAVDDEPFPLILVGPPGLVVLNARGLKGIFQARDEDWLTLDRRSGQYVQTSQNLITQTLEMARKIDTFLAKGEKQCPASQPVLFLAHPGVNVESNRPSARIVRVDGLDRFAAGLPQSEAVLDAVQVQAVVDFLAGAFAISQKEKADQLLKEQEQRLEKKAAAQPSKPARKINLDKRQIILLAVMGVVEILLLVAFVVLILFALR